MRQFRIPRRTLPIYSISEIKKPPSRLKFHKQLVLPESTFNAGKNEGKQYKINWGKLFSVPDRPLVIDAGCGPGKFLLRFAWEGVARDHAISNLNFLGIEIRRGLVDMAMRYRVLDLHPGRPDAPPCACVRCACRIGSQIVTS